MPSGLILAIDQGTTNTKALLVDRAGTPVFRTSAPLALLQPRPGFVEQDPSLIWQSVVQVALACASHARASGQPIEGIAISNQRETAVAWRPGPIPEPVGNAISWQCRRSTALCDSLAPHHARIREISGLPVDPLASAGKWTWLLNQNPTLRAEAGAGELHVGNVDAWLLANLTGGRVHTTDHSNASRTALFSLSANGWDDELLALFNLPRGILPAIQPSASHFGLCTAIPEIAGVPIVAMIGDSHAALVGHGSYGPGVVKATYGTGSSLMMLTAGLVPDTPTLARTVAWSDAEGLHFALEGNIAMTGSAVQWVGEFLGLARPVEDTIALAASVPDAAGLRFVPAMVGLGAPHWDSAARGLIANLGRTHTAAHLAQAALDAIAFQVADVLFAMQSAASIEIPLLRADGGVTRNDALMQFQANLLGRPVLRSLNEELSALGAAWLGGLTLGWWPSAAALEALPHPTHRFDPSATSVNTTLYADWQTAVARARLKSSEGVA